LPAVTDPKSRSNTGFKLAELVLGGVLTRMVVLLDHEELATLGDRDRRDTSAERT
jgi:hypothetical protein